MTRETWATENKKAANGTSKYLMDAVNPIFLFSMTPTELLVAIVNGEIDPVELAKRTLESQGLNAEGNWVGFGREIK
jgi:hypothetical protein